MAGGPGSRPPAPLTGMVNALAQQPFDASAMRPPLPGRTRSQQRRHLETYRFAAPGGQQRQGVVTLQYRIDNILLQGPERGVVPVAFQYRVWGFQRNEDSRKVGL